MDSASPLGIAPESSESLSCTDFESPIPSETRDQLEMPPADLRNYRYCEVLPAYTFGDRICVEVYNTLSFNACPEEKWATLDAETLQGGARGEFLVPEWSPVLGHQRSEKRFGLGCLLNAKVARFGDLQMGRPGFSTSRGWTRYPQQVVTTPKLRSCVPIRGSTLPEMRSMNLSPTGAVYIIQSYSGIVDSELTIGDLADLGTRLDLPEGGHFPVESSKRTSRTRGGWDSDCTPGRTPEYLSTQVKGRRRRPTVVHKQHPFFSMKHRCDWIRR